MRTYKKILRALEEFYPEPIPSKMIMMKINELYGYHPKEKTIYADLSRALKEGVIKRNEYRLYYIDKPSNEV